MNNKKRHVILQTKKDCQQKISFPQPLLMPTELKNYIKSFNNKKN